MEQQVKMLFIATNVKQLNQQIYDYANVLVDARNVGDTAAIIKQMNSKPETELQSMGTPKTEDVCPMVEHMEKGEIAPPMMSLNSETGEIKKVEEEVTSAIPTGPLDSRGIPWDSRIHTQQKTKIKDGSWRTRRGMDKSIVAQVEAEIKQNMAAPAVIPPSVPPVAEAITPTTEPVIAATNVQVAAPSVDVTPPTPQSEVTPLATPTNAIPQPLTMAAHSLETFKLNLVPTIANLVQTGKVTQSYINQLQEYFKVNAIFEIFNNDAHVEELFDNFVKAGLISKVA
jgi:hypothetical protein